MHIVCSQCHAAFKSLGGFIEHVRTHGFDPQSCLDGIEQIVRATIQHFYPDICPYCERSFTCEDYVSEEDIMSFIEKLKE